ncbi:hypothetical protein Q8A67_018576 [Cirrhinus molitorella]|uniref:Uncharacterized protein n=1 Tax=Cirrhinus molitorella TaxID=172907 RepID=A0AA88THH8_9TELE|nr:hypothetical protein Q8A67_018576 [Cirrhinus molitorella]
MSKGEAKRKAAACEAPLGFEPRISCLLDRRFNQLSHGAIPHGLGGEDVSEDQSIQRRGAARLKRVGPTAGPRMQAPRGFWRFDQLSHGARLFRFVRLGRYPSKAGEGVAWQGKPPAVLTLLRVPTRRPFLKKHVLSRIEARDQRHRWDSNPGSPVY